MNLMTRLALAGSVAIVTMSGAEAHDIVRRANSSFPIASSVSVPAGAELVFLSGMLADVTNPEAPAESAARMGNTAAQAKSALGKIARELEALGLGMQDVVKMNVYLVGDPALGGSMDFAGLMEAYMQYFGHGPDAGLPARTTLQVAGLPMPGALVEIEVIAARHPAHGD
jgi:enamine deaminase RidA (YjgF/YER057c/UK114 family)